MRLLEDDDDDDEGGVSEVHSPLNELSLLAGNNGDEELMPELFVMLFVSLSSRGSKTLEVWAEL